MYKFYKIFISLAIFLFINSADAHVAHYDNLKRIEFDIFRNNKHIGQHIFSFKKTDNQLQVESEINFQIKKLGVVLYKYHVKGTEYFENGALVKFNSKTNQNGNEVMLIYNQFLSVSPITTHIALKDVPKNISTKIIIKKTVSINKFYKNKLKKTPKFAVTGLNPHCESNFTNSEEDRIIKPAIKLAKNKGINVVGPFASDTLFIKKNIKKFDVIVGMYHDQVLGPIKTLYNFNAINITLGLPFIRISPDHGPNNKMLGQNKSDPTSLKEALIFLKKINGN